MGSDPTGLIARAGWLWRRFGSRRPHIVQTATWCIDIAPILCSYIDFYEAAVFWLVVDVGELCCR